MLQHLRALFFLFPYVLKSAQKESLCVFAANIDLFGFLWYTNKKTSEVLL